MNQKNPSKDVENSPRLPAHQKVYERLREMVLYGDLAPGQAITIQGLVAEMGAGMTPVREAIRRLTAEGALEFQGNRRVCVPLLTPDHIDELIVARGALEPMLAKRAAEKASKQDVVKLVEIDRELDAAIEQGDIRSYLRLNHGFHAKLYAIADAPILTGICDMLWLRFGPSLRVVCGRMGTQNLPDRHKEMLEAMDAQDADGAAEAIREDVIQGMVQIREALEQDGRINSVH